MSLAKFVKALAKANRAAEKADRKRQKEAIRTAKIQDVLNKKIAQRNAKNEKANQKLKSANLEAYKDSFRIRIKASPDESSDWMDPHCA